MSPFEKAMKNVDEAKAAFEAEWNRAFAAGDGDPDYQMHIEDLDDAMRLLDSYENAVRDAGEHLPTGREEDHDKIQNHFAIINWRRDEYMVEERGEGEDHGYEGLPSIHDDEDGNYMDPDA